jgi:hypothetical protein
MSKKSGFSDPITLAIVYGLTLVVVSWFHGSRCNNLKISGDNNTVTQSLSPQGGDTVSIPLTTADGKRVSIRVPAESLKVIP